MAAVKRSLNVGVVGMGRMGVPITRNLAIKSHSALYLQIHSRSLERARKVCDDLSIDGATCAMRIHNQYSTITKWCDVVLLALRDVEASRSVLLEHPQALLRNARRGQIIVDHTTVDVETSRECEAIARARGAIFLDAPMSGSSATVFHGQLTLMVGGDADAVARLQPIFRMYADSVHHMGVAPGAGSATKAIAQALVAMHSVAAAEAMTLAHRMGIEDFAKLTGVLDASWGASTMLRRNAATTQDLLRNPEKVPPRTAATVDALMHDLNMLHQTAAPRDGAAMTASSRRKVSRIDIDDFPLLSASADILEATSSAGLGDRDLSTVVHFLQSGRHNVDQRRQQAAAAAAAETAAPLVAASGDTQPAVSEAAAAKAKADAELENIEFY